ncbi:hypothetical protein [Henriciella marina]|uniref:hypothetical protein n=1 Tax=Henriciella marina TaxID=453851 RepID=UPI0018EF8C91|nr:hypothetical protein [Henriciella marina]
MSSNTPDHQQNARKEAPASRIPFRHLTTGARTLLRQSLAALGLVLIIIAIPIAFLTPILPVGLPMAILGVVLLGRNAVWGRRWMERMMARHPRLERFAPNWLMRAVFRREKRARD